MTSHPGDSVAALRRDIGITVRLASGIKLRPEFVPMTNGELIDRLRSDTIYHELCRGMTKGEYNTISRVFLIRDIINHASQLDTTEVLEYLRDVRKYPFSAVHYSGHNPTLILTSAFTSNVYKTWSRRVAEFCVKVGMHTITNDWNLLNCRMCICSEVENTGQMEFIVENNLVPQDEIQKFMSNGVRDKNTEYLRKRFDYARDAEYFKNMYEKYEHFKPEPEAMTEEIGRELVAWVEEIMPAHTYEHDQVLAGMLSPYHDYDMTKLRASRAVKWFIENFYEDEEDDWRLPFPTESRNVLEQSVLEEIYKAYSVYPPDPDYDEIHEVKKHMKNIEVLKNL